MFQKIFEPIPIEPMKVNHRFVLPPMSNNFVIASGWKESPCH